MADWAVTDRLNTPMKDLLGNERFTEVTLEFLGRQRLGESRTGTFNAKAEH